MTKCSVCNNRHYKQSFCSLHWKEYFSKNNITRKEYLHNYYLKNKTRLNNNMKLYRQKNKDKINHIRLDYNRHQYKTNIQYRVLVNLRSRLGGALKRVHTVKKRKTLELLGCSLLDFKLYLESQFKPGMNWQNRNLWHIDHIIPVSKFNLSKISEHYKAFHYTNLRPLWAEENQIKYNKVM